MKLYNQRFTLIPLYTVSLQIVTAAANSNDPSIYNLLTELTLRSNDTIYTLREKVALLVNQLPEETVLFRYTPNKGKLCIFYIRI